jgi:hypothetical protein
VAVAHDRQHKNFESLEVFLMLNRQDLYLKLFDNLKLNNHKIMGPKIKNRKRNTES